MSAGQAQAPARSSGSLLKRACHQPSTRISEKGISAAHHALHRYPETINNLDKPAADAVGPDPQRPPSVAAHGKPLDQLTAHIAHGPVACEEGGSDERESRGSGDDGAWVDVGG